MAFDRVLCNYRWRRTVPLVVFIFTAVFIHLYGLYMKDTNTVTFVSNTFKSLKSFGHPEVDKRPLHVLLVSYARTGSSFVGDLLQNLPGTFYYFEPLHFFSNPVLNNSFDEARELLSNVFTCNVSQIEGFLKWHQLHKSYMKFQRSFKYWSECSKRKNTCFSGRFIDAYCRRHDTVIAKTIRLRLQDAEKLFKSHPHLNLKVIYLVRDPRGSISSRTKYPISIWCKKDPMCSNPVQFCNALDRDLNATCRLMRERPQDFIVIRYDDLALDPYPVAERLLKFLGLPGMDSNTETFLRSHTSVEGNIKEKSRSQGVAIPYSTFRNSSVTAMSWRQTMLFKTVSRIQRNCHVSLKGFGYHSYATHVSLRANVNFDSKLEDALKLSCEISS